MQCFHEMDRKMQDETNEGRGRFVLILNYWAVQYMNDNRYTAALDLLKSAEKLIPQLHKKVQLKKLTLCNLAVYFKQRRKIQAAMQYLEQALRIEAKMKEEIDPGLHLNYGVLLCTCSRQNHALHHFGKTMVPLFFRYEERKFAWTAKNNTDDEIERRRLRDALNQLMIGCYNMWAAKMSLKQADATECIREAAKTLCEVPPAIRPTSIANRISQIMETLPPETMEDDMSENSSEIDPLPKIAYKAGRSARRCWIQPTTPRLKIGPVAQQFRYPVTTSRSVSKHPDPSVMSLDAPLFTTRPSCRSIRHDPAQMNLKSGTPRFMMHIHGVPPTTPTSTTTTSQRGAAPSMGSTARALNFVRAAPSPHATPSSPYASCPTTPGGEKGRSFVKNGFTYVRVNANSVSPASAAPPPPPPHNTTPTAGDTTMREKHNGGLSTEDYAHSSSFRNIINASGGGAPGHGGGGGGPPFPLTKGAVNAVAPMPPKIKYCEMARLKAVALLRARKTFPALRHVSKEAAIKIQKLYRGYSTRMGLKDVQVERDNKRRAALRIVYAARRAYIEYASSTKIQSHFRGFLFRKTIREEIRHVANRSATLLQRRLRGFVRKNSYCAKREAALRIQTFIRRHLAMNAYSFTHAQVLIISRSMRGAHTRIRHARALRAQSKIGAFLRGTFQRWKLDKRHAAAREIQRHVRGLHARHALTRQRDMQTRISKRVRGNRARERLKRAHAACVRISAVWRGYTTRLLYTTGNLDYSIHPSSSCTIVRRGTKEERGEGSRTDAVACTMIQALFRGVRTRGRVRQWYGSAQRIQARVRGMQGRAKMVFLVAATVCIQSHRRRVLAQAWCFRRSLESNRDLTHHSTRYLHKLASFHFLLCQVAARVIQRRWRWLYDESREQGDGKDGGRKKCKILGTHYQKWKKFELSTMKTRESKILVLKHGTRGTEEERYAIVIQSQWRGHKSRKRDSLLLQKRLGAAENKAAMTIQTQWRSLNTPSSSQIPGTEPTAEWILEGAVIAIVEDLTRRIAQWEEEYAHERSLLGLGEGSTLKDEDYYVDELVSLTHESSSAPSVVE